MKHIKLYEDIDWDNWDIEENDTPNKFPDDISEIELEEYINKEVRISEDSEYYKENTSTNPKNINGRIIKINYNSYSFPIQVKWDNGEYNVYDKKDLELI